MTSKTHHQIDHHRKPPPMLILWVSVGLAFARISSGQSPAIHIPDPEHLLDTLKEAHPRLLADATTFSRLRERVRSEDLLRQWHARLQESGERILRDPPSRYEIPDGLRLLSTSRRVLQRTYTLALLYRLERDARYLQRAWQELETAAAFQDWNPKHFLDTAEMTHAFAIGYDWLHDAWSEDQRDHLRVAIREKGLKLGVASQQGNPSYGWWTRAQHNWNQVCNGGIAMGALAIAEAEPALARDFLHAALQSIQLPMHHFDPDGAWNEGPGYWNYATSYNCVFLAALESALGTDFGLSQMPGFTQTGLFPLYVTGPLGRTFNYGDGGDGTIRAPHLFWLADKFQQPACAAYQLDVASPHPLDLLWCPSGPPPVRTDLPLDKYFRDAEVVTFRSAWQDRNALFVGFKAGDNKANHSNLDLGTFVLDALGYRWAVDLGADNYNLPGYFGSQRWNYYRLRAEGHNTLVLNPSTQPDQNPRAATRIIQFQPAARHPFAIADLSPAYSANAGRVWRGIQMPDRKHVLVQDEIELLQPGVVWWSLHTPASAQVDPDGLSATLRQGTAQLRVRLLAPPGAFFTLRDAEPFSASPHPAKQAVNKRVRKLAVHLKEAHRTRLAILLTPLPGEKPAPEPPQPLKPLSEW